jgi:hypothetical protein
LRIAAIGIGPRARSIQLSSSFSPEDRIAATVVDQAISKLTELGGEHAALVQEWRDTGANPAEEIAYAKAAFSKHATPELIAKVDASGLGNDHAVLKFLAKQGRLDAGMMGDFTMVRNGEAPSRAQVVTRGSGTSAAQAEFNKLYKDNPPGTEQYKNLQVQKRIAELAEIIGGGGNIVGQGGRTA